jgi:hypothetical protein
MACEGIAVSITTGSNFCSLKEHRPRTTGQSSAYRKTDLQFLEHADNCFVAWMK